ncbi:heme peroxidase, partial [Lojkania enalia]
MIWRSAPLALILLACREYVVGAQQTWPASIDELEDIMLLNTGYRARGFADAVTPCSKGVAPGRRAAAEWILTAFHDVSTGNVFTGVGGLDASIVFEAVGAENVGPAFTQTLTNFAPFLSSRSSMADLIAMGVYTAVRSCGGPIIPIRAGRRDATSGGGTGVPQPQNSLGTFRNQFTRFGFGTDAEMIQLVACGHTVGGVHGESHPLIVPPGSAPNDVVSLDSTPDVFDNKIVTEWLDWNTTDPMVVGPSIQNTRDSDKRVFIADGNVTMNALRSPETFRTVCQQVLQKMIDVVPSGVVLTAAIQPYEVKPYDVQLTLLGGGLLISFSGDIRIRTTNRPSASIANVQLVYKDRTGTSVSTPIGTFHSGEAQGFDDTFTFYGFSEILPTDTSISSFNVVIYSTSGSYEVLDNNGDGFVVDDSILYQEPQSCLDASGMLTVVAAVRNGISASPSLKVVVKNPRSSPVVVSALSTATAAMATQSAIGAYQLYSAAYTFSSSQDPQDSSFGVFAGSASDDFKKVTALHTACTPLGTTAPSPTSSLTIISTSSTTPTPTPSGFVHQGCYFDALVPRALSGPSTTDEQMTVAKCTTFCSSHQYFGLEYGQECYCGNTLDSSSYLVSSTECNMACSGDPSEMCGAASRMNLYKNSSRSTPISPQIDGYNNLGCYNEPSSVRALSDKETSSSTMTVESCASFCSGATYFGVEYGSECYCGSTLNTDSTKQPDADCSMVCSGNGSELCGGPYRLNIYQKNSTSA